MLHLVIGTTGIIGLGRQICRLLVENQKTVRALVRPTSDPNRVKELKELGVEIVEGDLKDPASLKKACQGVSAVLTTATMVLSTQSDDSLERVDRDGYLSLIGIAADAGVKQFIYTSYSINIQNQAPCALTDAKQAVEKKLRASGMTYTILRPSYFTECWFSPSFLMDFANRKATVLGSGDAKVSWIAIGDVARFAVESLSNAAARNTHLELGGPAALSTRDVVALAEKISGAKFTVTQESEAELNNQRNAVEGSLMKSLVSLKRCAAQGDAIDMKELMKAFPTIKLKSVEDFLQEMSQA